LKFFKFLIVPVVVLGIILYGVYYFGTNIASEKVMDAVTTELENSGQIDEIKQVIETDPELKSFIEEAKAADTSELPFETKEEATRVLIKKVGISELNDIRVKVQDGTASKEEILQEIQGKLTEEELLALKVIAYKELYEK
jgi:2-hydroxy-3-keto-5-methylthiopentenyl-1-phosphate phosphatase